MNRGFDAHEKQVSELFGLRRTISSGNRFFDPGDAVSHTDSAWPIYAEAKYTERSSFTLQRQVLADSRDKAWELGRHLIFPIRFWPRNQRVPDDYVLLGLYDLHELIEKAHHE